MKKVFLIIIGTILWSNVSAQSVNGVPFEEIDVEFVQILGTSKLMSNKVSITINFGQENKFWTQKDDGQVIDENGNKRTFNTMIDALNFMHSIGYEYVDAYAVTLGNQNVYHFLCRKVRS